MKIGVVGYGVVGAAMSRQFGSNPANDVLIYDKFRPPYDGPARKKAIHSADLVFLCVPTPEGVGGHCDLSAIEESVEWITAPICIRSTVVPGTVDRLSAATGRPIAFSPEYLGESAAHPWREDTACGFVIVGGPPQLRELVMKAYRTCGGPEIRFYQTDARTAELCKYMENSFLAAKVAFVNQFYDVAQALGVDWEELRDLWLADSRIGHSHTQVTAERGFRGRCLPKDVAAIVAAMQPLGGAPLLEQILAYNRDVCKRADQAELVETAGQVAAAAGSPA